MPARPYNRRMITLAPAALERIRGFLAETPAAIGLRLGVRRIGWSISDADLAEIDAIFARHDIDTTPDFWIEEA